MSHTMSLCKHEKRERTEHQLKKLYELMYTNYIAARTTSRTDNSNQQIKRLLQANRCLVRVMHDISNFYGHVIHTPIFIHIDDIESSSKAPCVGIDLNEEAEYLERTLSLFTRSC